MFYGRGAIRAAHSHTRQTRAPSMARAGYQFNVMNDLNIKSKISTNSRKLNLMYIVSILISISVINIKINAFCGIMNLLNIKTAEEK